MTVANLIGATLSSYQSKIDCGNNLLRVITDTADFSIEFLEKLAELPGSLLYFQAYGLDGQGNGGSIFIVGGDATFMKVAVRQLQSDGVHLAIY
ncbi:MAG: hypothetical protein UW64_C0010G0002 [Microgenomates group bacterium GW2011_GWC1_44_37]|nr:MAG: hypothetical protein UW56_C0019G0002 [Candidatus Collierbacteria bacterium GW2011_GWD1_44_27]KKT68763.1 MAG: hypothetical protein UW64_C0010G0002 [Microgenomates group bacterium GW2011_GWC1_44_37]